MVQTILSDVSFYYVKCHTYLCIYYVQAALCSIRIIKKVPDLAENFVNPVASLLKEKHHGVLLTAIQLCADLCIISEEALEYFRKVYWACFSDIYTIVCWWKEVYIYLIYLNTIVITFMGWLGQVKRDNLKGNSWKLYPNTNNLLSGFL